LFSAFHVFLVKKDICFNGSSRKLRDHDLIADNKEYKLPATIDDPATLDEMAVALTSIGYAKGRK